MRKIIYLLSLSILFLSGCGDKKKEDVKKETEPTKEEVTVEPTSDADAKDQQITLGEKLFTEKTCVACHSLDTKVIGPSIKDIIKIYTEKNGNLVKFLKGNSEAIVDTDPGQVAIMKANLEGFVKDMTPEELQAITAYMRSAAK